MLQLNPPLPVTTPKGAAMISAKSTAWKCPCLTLRSKPCGSARRGQRSTHFKVAWGWIRGFRSIFRVSPELIDVSTPIASCNNAIKKDGNRGV